MLNIKETTLLTNRLNQLRKEKQSLLSKPKSQRYGLDIVHTQIATVKRWLYT